ncbi:hypothetical protein, partial [Bacteroides cellulosilyticus]
SYKIKNTELNLNPVFSIYTKYFIVPGKSYQSFCLSSLISLCSFKRSCCFLFSSNDAVACPMRVLIDE